ncbi:MAG: agmatinase family protein [Spirochaetota bacterium]
MHFSIESEKLILEVPRPRNWVPDQYDVGMSDIMVDWKKEDKLDAGIVGIPFDTAVMGRRGCRFGPESVRNALVFSNVYEPGIDVDLSKNFSVTDFGNIDVLQTDVPGTHQRVEQVMTGIFQTGTTPVIIGGDHSLAYPDAKALINNVEGHIGVIMIDGHLDVRISHHGELSSGTPFRRLMEEPHRPVLPRNFVQLGINGWLNSRFYMDYCRQKGVTVIPAREVHKRGIEDAVSEAVEKASQGTDAIYLSMDIDGLDMAVAPGTCAPNPGGLSAYEALEAVWMIGRHPLSRGFEIMEVAPTLDNGSITSIMAATLVMHYLGAIKKRKEEKYGLQYRGV